MRCVSYMRKDSYWRDERCDYHKPSKNKKGDYGYYDLDGDLIAQQREHIRSYAEELGWEIVEEYIDIEGLDAFERLKRDCFNRRFDGLITDSIYRFADDIGEACVTLWHIFIPVGIQVAVAQDRFCSSLSEKKDIKYYFKNRTTYFVKESDWIDRKRAKEEGEYEERKRRKGKYGPRSHTILGSRIHDGETGGILRFSDIPGTGVFYRECDMKQIKWEISCPVVSYEDIIESVRKVLHQERTAAEWAKENIFSDTAEKRKAELLAPLKARAEQLLEKSEILLTGQESTAGRRLAKVDKEFNAVMDKVKQVETAYSLANPWIRRFEGIDIPMDLTNRHIKIFIEDIRVFGMDDRSGEVAKNGMERSEGYSVQIVVRGDEFRSLLPDDWLPELTFDIPCPAIGCKQGELQSDEPEQNE